MTRRASPAVLALVAIVTVSCAGQPSSPAASSAEPAADDGALPCGDAGYPCTHADTDPEVRKMQGVYAAEIVRLLDAGSRDEAFRWVQEQEGVVESHLSETLIMFRVDGALPMSIITPLGPASGSAAQAILLDAGAAHGPSIARQAAAEGPVTPRLDGSAAVVGVDTDREHPQNLKRALFLEPWATGEGSLFGAGGRVDPNELLGSIKPDFDHPDAVTHYIDGQVTPDTFSSDTWRQYDFIYVSTHGGTWGDGTAVLETGVRQLWNPNSTIDQICDKIIAPYQAYRGVGCGVEQSEGRAYVTVDVTHIFFLAYFLGEGRQLDRAIVVIEACESLKYTQLAQYIVGTSSAYLGWTSFINLTDARDAAGQLLVQLTGQGRRGKTVGAAMETLCDAGQCGGEYFRDPTTSGEAPWLRVHNNGDIAPELRLYALPTPRDPNDPTNILEEGSELRIQGTPGDGTNDRLEVTAEIVGVIDPDEAGNGGGGLGDIVYASSHDVAALYDVQFYVGDALIGSDNLGTPRESAKVEAVDETTYRYTNTFPLPFDVDPDGTYSTLRVVVDLPEGGISDYEIGVVLIGSS